MTHYNSDALQINSGNPTILSKIPALILDNFKLFHKRETVSPIDIYKIQSLYHCQLIKTPSIKKEPLEDAMKSNFFKFIKDTRYFLVIQ